MDLNLSKPFVNYCEENPDRTSENTLENDLKTNQKPKREPKPKDPNGKPSHLITYDLYTSGLSLSKIAKDRNMSLVTIQSHLIRCAEEGHSIDWEKELPNEYLPLIEAAVQEAESDKLKPIKELLPEEISYFMIKAYFFLKNN